MKERSDEQNALVFADICSRLAEGMRGGFRAPVQYGVPCCCYVVMEDFGYAQSVNDGWLWLRPLPVVGADMMFEQIYVYSEGNGKWDNIVPVSCVRPYLRHLADMSGEEFRQYMSIQHESAESGILTDWLNQHMFDYRGLIRKGLALPAPDGMYHFDEEQP